VARNQFKRPAAMFDRLGRNRDGFVSKEDFNAAAQMVAATAATAAKPPTTAAAENPTNKSGDFQLNGERWTYREGEFVMNGILLKPKDRAENVSGTFSAKHPSGRYAGKGTGHLFPDRSLLTRDRFMQV